MARVKGVRREEPKDNRDTTGADQEGSDTDSTEVLVSDLDINRTLDRVHPRQVLRDCAICGEKDIEARQFKRHLFDKHPPTPQTLADGAYACWSGRSFWWPAGPTKGPCKWLCSVCGEVRWYWGTGNTHGGPERLLDRRYGLSYCSQGRYPNHKRYLGKIAGAAGPVVFYHEGAPNPEQPVQDDPSLAKFIQEKSSEKGIQGEAKPKKSGKGNGRVTGRLSD